MSDPVGTPPPAPPIPAIPAAKASPPVSPYAAPPAGAPSVPVTPTDQVTSLPRLGSASPSASDRPIDWGRVGIAAGLAPVGYVTGVIMHEAVGHGGMALALGGKDLKVTPYPHTYERADGSTGVRFAAMSYMPRADWKPGHYAAVMLGPSILDTTIIAGGTTLYETGNWPKNPWISGALFVTQAAATVDLGFNGAQGLIQPNNQSVDTVRAANLIGMHPSALGAIQTGIAVVGIIELVRIGNDVLRQPATPEAKAEPAKPTVSLMSQPLKGGGMLGVQGTF